MEQIRKQLLRNPNLGIELSPKEIPLSEIRLLSRDEVSKLEEYFQNLGDLVKNWDQLLTISKQTNIDRFTLEKICSCASILIENTDESYLQLKTTGLAYVKVVFTGLYASGKTSIIRYLKRTEPLNIYNDSIVTSPRPTVGLDRTKLTFNEIPIILWELGGQEAFIDTYLDDPRSYFSHARAIVFVIDGKDEKKLETSLTFLQRLYSVLKENEQTINKFELPKIYYVVNKMDNGIENAAPLIAEIAERISEILPNTSFVNVMQDIYATSILKGNTISYFFGRLLEEIIPFRRYINEGLETLSLIYDFDFSCLINPDIGRLPLGWQHKQKIEPKKIIDQLLDRFEEGLFEYRTFTVNTGMQIKEVNIIRLKILRQEYFYIYIFGDDVDLDQILMKRAKIQELAIRAIEPQLRFIQLAFDPNFHN